MTDSFGFRMGFEIMLEKATIYYDCTRDPAFQVCPESGGAFTPDIEAGDGYLLELVHFTKAITGQSLPEIIMPQDSLHSVELIEAELKSAQSAQKVEL